MTKKVVKRILTGLLCAVMLIGICAILLYYGILQFNHPNRNTYPLRGVDVSIYQGDIDWTMLADQDIQFAFIKATEGSHFVDRKFEENWSAAQQTDLYIGAYHFFSYDSPGKDQALLFLSTVPRLQTGKELPPVIDIEFYADKEKNPPDRDEVLPELTDLISELEQSYRQKPILYCTMKSYKLYIAQDFADYPIWIRDVTGFPMLPDGRDWTFWQYSSRGKLAGYEGEEPFIDLNVFCGDEQSFLQLMEETEEAQ